jgi:hypothetical protein
VRMRRWIIMLVAAACALPAAAQTRDTGTFTPMPLDSGFGPLENVPPAVPADQIIKELAAKETLYKEARSHYTYRRAARVQTINDDGKVDGQWYEVDDVTFSPGGGRLTRVVYAPPSTLTRIMMSQSDLYDIEYGYPFVLTTADLPEYNVAYVGRQRIDQIDCYAFDVSPKVIEKGKRYLDGRIWVDSKDFQIVVTDGRMVPDNLKKGQEDLHAPFMTWRQQIDGKFWFPVYTAGEGILHFTGGSGFMDQDVHVRDIVTYSDYKRFGSNATILYNGQVLNNPGQTPQPPSKH